MGKLKVRLDFLDAQGQQILAFVDQINREVPWKSHMTVDTFCKQAVMYAMQKSYEDAVAFEQSQKKNKEGRAPQDGTTHDTQARDSAGNSTESQSLPSISSPVLSDETATSTNE